MDLPTLWFALIAVLWTGYLVLDGFDLGVGMLLPVLARNCTDDGNEDPAGELRRRTILTTIGPHWAGNEVWIITAVGAIFAAFPHWYATTLSALYLPVLALLVALILRDTGLKYRDKRDDATWRRRWDAAIVGGSLAVPMILGTALTALVHGLPMRRVAAGSSGSYTELVGGLVDVLQPVPLLGGLTVVGMCLTHGAHFLTLKTEGEIRARARGLAGRSGIITTLLAAALLLVLGAEHGGAASWTVAAVVPLALGGSVVCTAKGAEVPAFVGTSLALAGLVAAAHLMLAPNVVNGRDGGPALSIADAASSPLTLQVITWATALALPVVVAYTVWTYRVFRRRLTPASLPGGSTPAPAPRPDPVR